MFLCRMIVAMLGNWFLGTELTQEFKQSPTYNPVYLNVHIISLSKKNKKVFKNVDRILFHWIRDTDNRYIFMEQKLSSSVMH